ncbi:MAG: hypothetical protein ABIK89_18145, partial [Planctomycetota bacterium]
MGFLDYFASRTARRVKHASRGSLASGRHPRFEPLEQRQLLSVVSLLEQPLSYDSTDAEAAQVADPTPVAEPAAGALTAESVWSPPSERSFRGQIQIAVWTPELIADLPAWVRSHDWPEWMDVFWVKGESPEEMEPISVAELVHVSLQSEPRGGYLTILEIDDAGFSNVTANQAIADLKQLDFVDRAELGDPDRPRIPILLLPVDDPQRWAGLESVWVSVWTPELIEDLPEWVHSQDWPEWLDDFWDIWVEGQPQDERDTGVEIRELAHMPLQSDPRGGYQTILGIDGDFRVTVDQILADLEQLDFVDYAKLEKQIDLRLPISLPGEEPIFWPVEKPTSLPDKPTSLPVDEP